ncbi:MAG: sigma-54-dependent transcriptional regulator, partial [Lentisphaeria bacterium]
MSKKCLPDKPIIIVDDEEHATFGLKTTLKTSSSINNIITFNDSIQALEWVKKNEPSMALLDIGMPGVNGIELLRCIKNTHPRAAVIMITAEIDIDTAIQSIKEGAFDYITKPINHERLFKSLTNGLQLREKDQEVERLRESLIHNGEDMVAHECGIISNDAKMLSIFNYLKAVSSSSSPILINGETGTGKEVIVKLIHRYMGTDIPLVTCNVAGLDDHLFSDTLFGHLKGAFTGADKAREGLIVQAEGGILFLDEIGDLSITSQVKLLRLLQEREYLPLGADKPKKCNVRIIAATHRNLKEKMENELFRSDLYYRLGTHKVSLPPLRQRTNDIPLLFNYFLENAASEMKKTAPTYSRNIPSILKTYSFPGNIREL